MRRKKGSLPYLAALRLALAGETAAGRVAGDNQGVLRATSSRLPFILVILSSSCSLSPLPFSATMIDLEVSPRVTAVDTIYPLQE